MTTRVASHPPHLNAAVWQAANRQLLQKALAEFAHEGLLQPQAQGQQAGWTRYRLPLAPSCYHFLARRLWLDHWQIDAASIRREIDGVAQPLDVLAFIVEGREPLQLSQTVLPLYLDEISSTLYGSAYKRWQARLPAAALALADYQTLESGMTEGHPVFVANNGRLGFGEHDYLAYAPECGRPLRLHWLAVARAHASYTHLPGLDQAQLLQEELGPETLARFQAQLRARQCDPADYWFMPVHPWQWQQRLVMAFAAELACNRIVYLGEGEDLYAAQQSIRTLFNLSQPTRRYVKTALSILNMGFMRGLSPHYMESTPAINQWLHALVQQDAELQARGFTLLREVAAIGYRQPYYQAALSGNVAHKKQLSALWRESPQAYLRPGERLMTMAALLHVDQEGQALLPALIRASGWSCADWVRQYLDAYLRPLLHCFYQHDLVFMPHGENVILVLDGHVPRRVLMKDLAEEVALLNSPMALPGPVARIQVRVPEALCTLSILTDVFDGFFRFLAMLLQTQADYPQEAFWRAVAQCILRYQAAMPQLAAKFRQFDLFAPTFQRSCLNRLQLANNRQMLDLADPAQSLQFHGWLDNPIAPYRQEVGR